MPEGRKEERKEEIWQTFSLSEMKYYWSDGLRAYKATRITLKDFLGTQSFKKETSQDGFLKCQSSIQAKQQNLALH